MNEEPENAHEPESQTPAETGAQSVRRVAVRWLRHAAIVAASTGLLALIALALLYRAANSPQAQQQAKQWIIRTLNDDTGGRAEIGALRWNLLHLGVELDNVTIHGLEHSGEAPWVHVDHLAANFGVEGLLQLGVATRVVLHSAQIDGPAWHLEVYSDGTTNQPHPKHPRKPGKPFLDTLFDLKIGDLQVRRGVLQIADHTVPVDFRAQNASLYLGWLPTIGSTRAGAEDRASAEPAGTYRLLVNVKQFDLWQGPLTGKIPPMKAGLSLRALLSRNQLDLEQMQVNALNQTLAFQGYVRNFADPFWHITSQGNVDLRIVAPASGFPALPEGIATLQAHVDGHGADYVAEGELGGANVHYKDEIADARAKSVTAHFRATPRLLVVSRIVTQLLQGGEIDGDFTYDNWLFPTPHPGSAEERHYLLAHQKVPTSTALVHASLHHVSLDTVLLDLASTQFQHLGFDAQIDGETTTTWTGLAFDLAIENHLRLVPTGKLRPGLAGVNGLLDGTFYAGRGNIAVTRMQIHLPHSTVIGQGTLGVFPIDRPSNMTLDFTSSDLTEFDASLRALQLKSGNLVGAAALPAVFDQPSLSGSGRFQGTFTNSWLTPVVDGHLQATHLGVEIPDGNPLSPPKFVDWDSVVADGKYTPASILVRHAVLRRGAATLTLSGHIDTADPKYNLADTQVEFDETSSVQVTANLQQYPVHDLLALTGARAPVDGALSAQIQLNGKISALDGAAKFHLDHPVIHGVRLDRVDGSGSIHNQVVHLAQLHAVQGKGSLNSSGDFDLAHQSFQAEASGASIDVAPWLATEKNTVNLAGVLHFHATGKGSMKDPQVKLGAVVTSIRLGDQPFSDLHLDAHTGNHQVAYTLHSQQSAGDLDLTGTTHLDAQMQTAATITLKRFDLGAALEWMHITGITGQSDWEGTANVSGPLAHPRQMNGEARLEQLTAVLEGVHLSSAGPVHAMLNNGVAHLDPVEITGEDTDVHVKADVQIVDQQQMDIAASGAINLRLTESLDSDLVSSGSTAFHLNVNGTLLKPMLAGDVIFHRGAIALRDFPNGLSQIEGRLEFSQNRLEVRSLTAMSGGGVLKVGGYLGFQNTLYADLTATGQGIRIRYPQGVSSLADAKLRLQGPQNNLLLSGNVVITRFAIGSDLDMSAFSAPSMVAPPVLNTDAPSNHLRLDVHLTTSPQLTFQNAYNAKLAGDADLRLRGTLASPSVLGKISLTEGSASIGGTRYELQRGDITFNNPVRIEPNIDLDATARVEDYDIILGLHGTPGQLKVTYRSEPPLPETDVISLLTQGQTTEEQSVYVQQQQQQAGDNPTTEMLLGGALNATVSNRVQRLFGSGAVRVDPNFIGSVGNSSARVTVVEQIGPNLTFTFASNVNTTAQQLIQAEYAVNRHVSLLITQDENGIFSVVLKNRRRYR